MESDKEEDSTPALRNQAASSTFRMSLEDAIDLWGNSVLRLAVSRLGSTSDAEDIFQTVFLRLYQSETLFKDSEHLKAWLLRATINCCNDTYRSPWHTRNTTLDKKLSETLPAPPEGTCTDETYDELSGALATLTAAQHTAIHLYYFEGYSTGEIAKITDEKPATIRSHLFRAREALKIELGAQQ